MRTPRRWPDLARVLLLTGIASTAFLFGLIMGRSMYRVNKYVPMSQTPTVNAIAQPAPTIPKSMTHSAPAWHRCGGGDNACCVSHGDATWRAHTIRPATMPGDKRVDMALYFSHDIVSNNIIATGKWDAGRTVILESTMKSVGQEHGVFLDVGANIGWFTLSMAYAGYRVIAIEPFGRNLAYLRHSLCLAPPEVRARVDVIPFGLAPTDGGTCELWHDPNNSGNTFVVCAESTAPNLKASSFRKLATVDLMSLDTLIANGAVNLTAGVDKVIVKIDTEGYEPFAFMGATKFLRDFHPAVIFTEFAVYMIRRAASSMNWSIERANALPQQFLNTMKNAGYQFVSPPLNNAALIHDVTLTATTTTPTNS